jgi:hypothetical protein
MRRTSSRRDERRRSDGPHRRRDGADGGRDLRPFRKPIDLDDEPAAATPVAPVQHWPALVEATAIACDAAARIDLADALGALRSAWAESILRQAYETEPDPAVRSAIASALSSSQSLVT